MGKKKFRMVTVFVLLPAALILVSGSMEPARGDNWELFGTQQSTGTAYYYDAKKIAQPAEGVVRVWVKKILGKKDIYSAIDIQRSYDSYTPQWEKLTYEMCLYELNCKDKVYTIRDVTLYTDKGEVLDNTRFDEKIKLVPIPAGSLTDHLFNKVCVPKARPKK